MALSTDGMNPFADMSVAHSTCPVVSVLISGKKQSGVKIHVYLRPLIDDLKTLWFNGVQGKLLLLACYAFLYDTRPPSIIFYNRTD